MSHVDAPPPPSPITTHVLDTAAGKPAAGVGVTLAVRSGSGAAATWQELGTGHTDGDGRLRSLLAPGTLHAGVYRLSFAVGSYYAALGVACFYPTVTIDFAVVAVDQHYHVPLLLSPFGYTTYRGS